MCKKCYLSLIFQCGITDGWISSKEMKYAEL